MDSSWTRLGAARCYRRANERGHPVRPTPHARGQPHVAEWGEPLTGFVGRDREPADVQRLLATTRLLSLVGTGGVGKTRLALKAAAQSTADYADGVFVVELAGTNASEPRPTCRRIQRWHH